MNLFESQSKESEQNSHFKDLNNSKAFGPAKSMIEEICLDMNDKDGNFAQQFQTTGYYPRLWEVFLHAFFRENQFDILDDYDRPDFHLKKEDVEMYVEACSSNPAKNDRFTSEFIESALRTMDKDVELDLKTYYTIKIGSILYSKLEKKYWENDWVKDKPLVLAVMPSHNKLAYFLPDYLVIEYLYGIWFKPSISDTGKLEGTSGIKEEHNHENKIIPSAFFKQENSEHISAVIFTNTCETQKFNRMGQQGEYYDENLVILRTGLKNDKTPGSMPEKFQYTVQRNEKLESWSEGVSVFHNPNCRIPLDRNLFKGVRQIWLNDYGELDGEIPDFYPFSSITGVLVLE